MADRKVEPIGIQDVGHPFSDGKSVYVYRLKAISAGPSLEMTNLDMQQTKTMPLAECEGWIRLIPETPPKRKYERKAQPTEVANGKPE